MRIKSHNVTRLTKNTVNYGGLYTPGELSSYQYATGWVHTMYGIATFDSWISKENVSTMVVIDLDGKIHSIWFDGFLNNLTHAKTRVRKAIEIYLKEATDAK